jgi:hypothetical protein
MSETKKYIAQNVSYPSKRYRRKEIFSYATYIIHKFDVRRTIGFNTRTTKTVRDNGRIQQPLGIEPKYRIFCESPIYSVRLTAIISGGTRSGYSDWKLRRMLSIGCSSVLGTI